MRFCVCVCACARCGEIKGNERKDQPAAASKSSARPPNIVRKRSKGKNCPHALIPRAPHVISTTDNIQHHSNSNSRRHTLTRSEPVFHGKPPGRSRNELALGEVVGARRPSFLRRRLTGNDLTQRALEALFALNFVVRHGGGRCHCHEKQRRPRDGAAVAGAGVQRLRRRRWCCCCCRISCSRCRGRSGWKDARRRWQRGATAAE